MSQSKPLSQNLRETERQTAEMDAMRRMISASQGTCSLSIAICNSPALRDYLTGELKEEIKAVEVVRISESTIDIFNFVCEKNIPPDTAAIFITDIEKLLPSDKKEHKILKALNASRELWKKNFRCPVVFWFPEYAATLLSVQARDLWSWLSHQFEFFSEQAHVSTGVSDTFAGDILAAGNLDTNQKRFRMAELEQRIREAEGMPKPELVGHILIWLNELAYLYYQIGDLPQAESILKKTLEIDEKLGRFEDMAGNYGNLGIIYRIRGELDKAEDMVKKSLEINEKLGRLEGMADQYSNLGTVYQTRGDLDKAEDMHKKSLEINEKLVRLEGMAISYGNLGIVYRIRGELDKAENMHKKSLEIEEKLGRLEGMASEYNNLGSVYETRGELDKSEDFYNKALVINEKLGRFEGMASQYGNLGVIYEKRGDLDKAEDMHNKSLKINEKLGRLEGMANQYSNLGFIYKTRGELDKAEDRVKKSLEINEKLGRLEGMAGDYNNFGIIYKIRGNFDKAKQYWLKAKKLYQQIGIPNMVEKTQQFLDSLKEKN